MAIQRQICAAMSALKSGDTHGQSLYTLGSKRKERKERIFLFKLKAFDITMSTYIS